MKSNMSGPDESPQQAQLEQLADVGCVLRLV